jgi:transporter family protein
MTESPSHIWVLWALGSALFAAFTAIFAKVGLENIDPDFATLIRTAVILLVLGAIIAVLGKWQDLSTLKTKSLVFLGLSAIATGASWICYFRALKLGPASRVAPIDKLSVVLVAFFAVFVLNERPSVRDWVGIASVAVGVLLLTVKR